MQDVPSLTCLSFSGASVILMTRSPIHCRTQASRAFGSAYECSVGSVWIQSCVGNLASLLVWPDPAPDFVQHRHGTHHHSVAPMLSSPTAADHRRQHTSCWQCSEEVRSLSSNNRPTSMHRHPPLPRSDKAGHTGKMVGSQLGSYRLIRQLGDGGMGTVYEGLNEGIERHVAIKVLHPAFARDPEAVTRFVNEARAVNRIEHPSLVQIHEHNRLPDGTTYIVMELLQGETLAQRLSRQKGPLSASVASHIAWQVATALSAAHAKQIVHRDIKPSNLMLVPDPLGPDGERVKILDFGIAKLQTAHRDHVTADRAVMGTPLYMSPEQCEEAGSVDGKSDVYSLGCILFEMPYPTASVCRFGKCFGARTP